MGINLTEARAVLLRIAPFWGYVMARVKSEVVDYHTSYTDGRGVYIAKEHLEDEKTAIGVLMHELVHIALLHADRGQELAKRYGKTVANLAMDAVANAEVYDTLGYHIPEAAVQVEGEKAREIRIKTFLGVKKIKLKKSVAEHSIEELCEVLEDVAQEMSQSAAGRGKGKAESGEGREGLEGWFDDHEKMKERLSDYERDKLREILKGAKEMAEKMRGTVPGWLEEVVKRLKVRERIRWDRWLRKTIETEFGADDYTFKKPHKRSFAINTYLPRGIRHKTELPAIVLDVSGSMGEKELGMALGVIEQGLRRAGAERCVVIQVDAEVQRVEKVSISKLKKYKVKGRGGTVLREGLREARKYGKRAIVITDGYTEPEDLKMSGMKVIVVCLDKEKAEELRKEGIMAVGVRK